MSQNTPQEQKKIELIIIGAQKAGTTSLKNYLGQHPALQAHPQKEFSFFFDKNEYNAGFNTAFRKYYNECAPNIRLIAKNAGLYVNPEGLGRLKEHNPACKLVLILRNPVERTYSSFLMEKNYGSIKTSFDIIESVIEKSDPTDWRYEFFVGMSLYAKAIANVYKHFPKTALHIVRYEEFSENPVKVCQEVYRFLNIDPSFAPDTSVRHNETRVTHSNTYGRLIRRLLDNDNPIKKLSRIAIPRKMDYKLGELFRGINRSNKKYAPMPPVIESRLIEFYRPHNEHLSELTGIDFSGWNQSTQES